MCAIISTTLHLPAAGARRSADSALPAIRAAKSSAASRCISSIWFLSEPIAHIISRYNLGMRFAIALLAIPLCAQTYDLVIAGGRVLDPATNLDAVRHIGIRDGKIAAISAAPLTGTATVDARNLTVTPGFIDLHSHGQTPENYR